MKKIKYIIAIFGLCLSAFAQVDGTLDNSFLPNNTGEKGADDNVLVAKELADGKILLGGSFDRYNGKTQRLFVRINQDGSIDDTFNPVVFNPNGRVRDILIQPDGKIVVGGDFAVDIDEDNDGFEDYEIRDVIRLNPDGSRDTSFLPAISATVSCGSVFSLALQSDNKIVVGGTIGSCFGNSDNANIYRLNTDGTIDTSFNANVDASLIFSERVNKIVVQSDGKFIIGGNFTKVNGNDSDFLARINNDGSFDASFDVSDALNARVYDLALQDDGKVIAVGDFNQNSNYGSLRLVRINADGTKDTSFAYTDELNGTIRTVAVQDDGKIVVGGNFNLYNNTGVHRLTRLNSNGSLDQTFEDADVPFISFEVFNNTILSDGSHIAVGEFLSFNRYGRSRLVKLTPNGQIDFSFNSTDGPFRGLDDSGGFAISTDVKVIRPAGNGKYFIAGAINDYNDSLVSNIVKINADGSKDNSFTTYPLNDLIFSGDVTDIAVQSDGKVVMIGDFDEYNNQSKNGIVRLNANGTIDDSFDIGAGFSNIGSNVIFFNSIAQQADGKLIITGKLNTYNGTSIGNMLRLNADGSLDTSFNPGAPNFFSNEGLNRGGEIVIDDSGKIYVGGFGNAWPNSNSKGIVRLNPDGSVDDSFEFSGFGSDYYGPTINDIVIDGCFIYIAGEFSGFPDPKYGILRLFQDGSVDTSFNPVSFNSVSSEKVFNIELQPDGKIIAAGQFNNIEPNDRDIRGLMRLNQDGSLDTTFNPDADPNAPEGVDIELTSTSAGTVKGIQYEPVNNRVILVGKFDSYNGSRKLPLIAVHASTAAAQTFSIPDANFEQALIDANIDSDGIVNSQMKVSDALCITDLNLNDKSIVDLTGIDNFTNLEVLSAGNNQITSVDLSSNLSLREINFSQNNIDVFDVSALNGLEILNVADNNLINLDVSLNTGLTAIDCSNNQLENLNLQNGNNTNISDADFNASSNPDLVCIKVDDVAYSNANWTNIDSQMFFSTDCSSLINIPDPNFEQALIDLNVDSDGTVNGFMVQSDALGVIDLDVSGQNISDLTGIEFFTDLETLSAFNNNITSVDLSQNINLISADLGDNSLNSINFSNNPNLVAIGLSENNLSSIDLSTNINITQVFIENNNLSSIDVTMLPGLTDLALDDNGISSLDVSQNPVLDRLFCNNNLLQSLNIQNGNNTFFTNLEAQNNPSLTCVQVDDIAYANNNWLDPSSGFLFDSQVFFSQNCGGLVNVPDSNFEQELINEGIDTDGVINGLFSPSNAIGVTSLVLNDLNISDLTGIEAFIDLETLFALNNNLSTVDLSANVALDGLILGNNNLTSIDLSNNVNLASIALAFNQLTSLDLSNNSALTQVLIQDNLLTDFDATSLPNLIQLNVSQNDLTLLDLSQNPDLNQLFASDNNLISLNLKNGNNASIPSNWFDATLNQYLTCIQVDDANYSSTTWNLIDSQSFFSEDCEPDNDDCLDADVMFLGQDTLSSTFSSTPSGVNPNCLQAGLILFDVWFEFTVPASGSIDISVVPDDLSLNGNVALYNNCNDLTPIACGSDILEVDNLIPGETYHVQVWLEAGASGLLADSDNIAAGAFTINVEDSTLSTTVFSEELSFNIYPNPTDQFLNIECASELSSYQIYDINGRNVQSESNLNALEKTIDVSTLSAGMYLIKVSTDNSTSIQKLIIK